MEVNLDAFAERFPPACRVCLDTAPLIYHLEDVAPYAGLTARLLERLSEGEASGILSTVTATELLTKPLSLPDPKKAALAENFLLTLPNCSLLPVTYEVAGEAARLRAHLDLRTPDAIIAATALQGGATHLLTNDPAFRRLASPGLAVVILDDFPTPG